MPSSPMRGGGVLATSLIWQRSLTALDLGDVVEPVVADAPLQLIMSVSTSTHLAIHTDLLSSTCFAMFG